MMIRNTNMASNMHVQLPQPHVRDSFKTLLDDLAAKPGWDTVSVAVAYSSVSGVRAFYDAVRLHHPQVAFRWLLGLDDYVTQPGAISFCESTPNSELRVFISTRRNSRFHPKLYLFENRASRSSSSIIVGSANLTFAALNRNCEAVTVLSTSTPNDSAHLAEEFESVWALGVSLTAARLKDYSAKYDAHRSTRSFAIGVDQSVPQPRSTKEVLSSDVAEIDPGVAKVCWIEVGKNTAQGRELEFKAEQALFFGLAPTGGTPETRDFELTDGSQISLRLKYQGNAMWRLQMTNAVPDVRRGLRPSVDGTLGRSPFVAVFERKRLADTIRLRFIRCDSNAFAAIRAKSVKRGTIGITSSREYGWY